MMKEEKRQKKKNTLAHILQGNNLRGVVVYVGNESRVYIHTHTDMSLYYFDLKCL